MNRSRAAYERRNDAELIRLAPRDSVAFRTLYDRHATAMQQWIYAQVEDATTARELLAETWAAAWRACSRFRGEDDRAGAAWLYTIARNLVIQYHRRQRVATRARRRLQMSTVIEDDGDLEDLPRRLDAAELSPAVREAFAQLSDEQREAIGYRVIGECSYEEIAHEMGISQATARTRVFRGLQVLRGALK